MTATIVPTDREVQSFAMPLRVARDTEAAWLSPVGFFLFVEWEIREARTHRGGYLGMRLGTECWVIDKPMVSAS